MKKRFLISGITGCVMACAMFYGCGSGSGAAGTDSAGQEDAVSVSDESADGASDSGTSSDAAFEGGVSSDAASESGAASASSEDDSYTQDFFAMDTYMTLTAYGENAQAAVEAGAAEIERLDALLSTGDPDSEIYALNAAGGGTLSDETAYLVERSLEVYENTGGLYDISIYPVMELWGFTAADESSLAVPDASELAETLS
ncbi:MAG: FAD:protein FMN transferase, partial [Lachnospiraceae bacterium]|nr:FAD:protein FMN transferase [Lachnospiraceae bacterium]